jgi:hypothetical protein
MSFRPGEAQIDLAASFLSLSNSWCLQRQAFLRRERAKRAICVAINRWVNTPSFR